MSSSQWGEDDLWFETARSRRRLNFCSRRQRVGPQSGKLGEHGEGQNHKALARVPHQEVGPGTRFPWAQGTRASAMRGRPGLLLLVGGVPRQDTLDRCYCPSRSGPGPFCVGPGTRFPWARGARAELERQLKFEFTREWAAPSGRGGERKKGDL